MAFRALSQMFQKTCRSLSASAHDGHRAAGKFAFNLNSRAEKGMMLKQQQSLFQQRDHIHGLKFEALVTGVKKEVGHQFVQPLGLAAHNGDQLRLILIQFD